MWPIRATTSSRLKPIAIPAVLLPAVIPLTRMWTPSKQLQRTVITQRGIGRSAPFHYALVPRFTRQRAAADLRR